MSRMYRALALLLAYPSAELQQHIGDVREALAGLPRGLRIGLEPLLTRLEHDDILDLQASYSDLFDRSRQLSLNMFEHVHGDSRERGQAMVDLTQQYVECGLLLDTRELPDFIPVFLEYVSCLEPSDAREALSQPVHVFAALANRLDKRRSDYSGVFHVLVGLASASPAADAIAELEERTGEEDPSRLDDDWQEAPVTFLGGGAHDMGGPTGWAAKVRAARRPVAKGG